MYDPPQQGAVPKHYLIKVSQRKVSMNTVIGFLRRLGESTVDMDAETKKYSVIEVGERVIPNITVSRKLANFVSDGVGNDVTLHLHRSTIVACIVNGKTYYESQFASKFGTMLARLSGAVAAIVFMVVVPSILSNFISFRYFGGLLVVRFVFLVTGAVLGYYWGKRTFAIPKEIAQWKAQGAIAV